MKTKFKSTDSDILPALRRAAVRARKLAETTGTPFYVMRGGRIVNLNPKGRLKKPAPRPL